MLLYHNKIIIILLISIMFSCGSENYKPKLNNFDLNSSTTRLQNSINKLKG